MTGFAIVGCGYVADFYMATLGNHPGLELAGAWDHDAERLRAFTAHHGVRAFGSLDEALADDRVELVANLTNPRSHLEVSRAALEAGRHVWSEKPLAMDVADARSLTELAAERGLLIASAPASLLSETAQTMWKALRDGRVGTPRLVYAELDDGHVPSMGYQSWRSDSGAPWPAKDEFEVGATLEHAGYYLTWLTAFFGPVARVTSFAAELLPDKGTAVDVRTPDFTSACLEFGSGVVARLTNSIVAPHDHRLTVVGDEGWLATHKAWNYGAPVHVKNRTRLASRLEKYPLLDQLPGVRPRKVPLVRKADFDVTGSRSPNRMDFCRGPAELAAAAREGRPPLLPADWSLHVNEVTLAIQYPERALQEMETTFEPLTPAPWAR